MAYNSTIDKDTDDILIYGNTAKDGSGTDYVPLLDADGQLQVDVVASGLPTGASTSANQTTIIGHLDGVEGLLTTIDADTGSILTSVDGLETSNSAIQTAVELLDDTVATLGTTTYTEAATKGLTIGAVRRDADTTLVNTTNEIGPLQMDANGRLKVEAFSGETLPVSLASVPSHAVTNAGTFAVQDATAQASLSVMDDWDNAASDGASISGDVAHDAVDAGEPVKIGGKAVSAEPAVVTANDRVNALFDLVGKLIVLPYANPENFVSGAITSAMTGTTSTSLIAAPAAGLRNYITQITVSNAHATVGTDVVIQDGSGGTTLYTIPAAAVYGGATITFPVPLRQPTTATAIFCANVTTGASTKVSASGYKGV